MGKLIQTLVLLLTFLTISTYSLPVPEDDSNESSDSSEESKERQISSSQPGYPNRNNCNIQKRDTVHTNAHQGGPPIPRLSSTTLQDPSKQNENPPITPYRNSQDSNDNQNRQVRDTDEQRTTASDPISLSSTDESADLPNLQQNVPATTNEENQNNRQVTNGDDQQTPGRILSSNPNSPSSSEQTNSLPNLNTQTSQTGGYQNRQLRETDDQQTPSRILVSDTVISSSTDRSATSYYPNSNIPATNNAGNQNNRQVRDIDDQQTPSRILASSPESTSSIESSDNQNRQIKDSESHEAPNENTSDQKAINDSIESDETKTGSSDSEPNVSSTEIPGDVYGENREKTEASREVRDTNNQESVPRVFASNPREVSSIKKPDESTNRNENSQNTEISRKLRDANTEEQKAPPSVTVIKKPDNLPAQNQELHPYETNRHRRDTSGEDYSKILIHNISVDGSTPIPDEIPVNVQNFEAKQRNLRETSNDEHKTTEEPDQVKIVKLDESPPYSRFQQ